MTSEKHNTTACAIEYRLNIRGFSGISFEIDKVPPKTIVQNDPKYGDLYGDLVVEFARLVDEINKSNNRIWDCANIKTNVTGNGDVSIRVSALVMDIPHQTLRQVMDQLIRLHNQPRSATP